MIAVLLLNCSALYFCDQVIHHDHVYSFIAFDHVRKRNREDIFPGEQSIMPRGSADTSRRCYQMVHAGTMITVHACTMISDQSTCIKIMFHSSRIMGPRAIRLSSLGRGTDHQVNNPALLEGRRIIVSGEGQQEGLGKRSLSFRR